MNSPGPGTRDPGPANSKHAASPSAQCPDEAGGQRHSEDPQVSGPGPRVPDPANSKHAASPSAQRPDEAGGQRHSEDPQVSGPGSRVPGPGISPIIALLAGEASGDQLGADLIVALRERFPGARFVGVGGPHMQAEGLDAWHGTDALSVMGFAEVIRHLPRLLKLRRELTRRLLALQPDVFVGIDAPDFNLGLERRLKQAGIPTVHYVSPSVWAWRENRVEKIGRAADRVLCLFPMEPPIYARHGIDARFVGHPLAVRFPMLADRAGARDALDLPQDQPVLAVLPGSRPSEIERLGQVFLETAQKVAGEIPGLRVVVPAANAKCRGLLEGMVSGPGTRDPGPANSENPASHEPPGSNKAEASAHAPSPQVSGPGTRDPGPANSENPAGHEPPGSNKAEASAHATNPQVSGPGSRVPGPANSENPASHEPPGSNKAEASAHAPSPQVSGPGSRVPGPELITGHAHEAMLAADVILLASGTATLEAMLAKRPMVVGYRVAPASYRIARMLKMLKTDIYALPNILTRADNPQAPLPAPELMQDDCTADKLTTAVLDLFRDSERRGNITAAFERLHQELRGDAPPGHPAAPAADAIADLIRPR